MRSKSALVQHWWDGCENAHRTEPMRFAVGLALEVLCDIRDTLVALGTLAPPQKGPTP
jgi:hypothetical protein